MDTAPTKRSEGAEQARADILSNIVNPLLTADDYQEIWGILFSTLHGKRVKTTESPDLAGQPDPAVRVRRHILDNLDSPSLDEADYCTILDTLRTVVARRKKSSEK